MAAQRVGSRTRLDARGAEPRSALMACTSQKKCATNMLGPIAKLCNVVVLLDDDDAEA